MVAQLCCRGGDPFQGSKVGSCLNTQKRIVRGDTCWQSKRLHWEGVPGWRAGGPGNPGDLLCHVALSLGFYGDRISFWAVSGQSFWLRALPGGAHIAQPRWILTRRILGGQWDMSISFWSFPNSTSCWWLFSSVFLTRTSCCKITHRNGYYGAWWE